MAFSMKSAMMAIAVVCAMGYGNSGNTMAQETDDIARSHETIRLRYEDRLEDIRRDVFNEIDRMRRLAVREDDPVAARKRIDAVEDAFRNAGELPDARKRNAWIKEYNDWKDTLVRSYAKTVVDYQAVGNDARAEVVAAEQELFSNQFDLVPWGPNLIESPVEVTSDKPLEIEVDIKGEYRIEIQATRVEGEGALWIELPVSDNQKVRVPFDSNGDGILRAFLTVTPELVSADASVDHPFESFAKVIGTKNTIVIDAVGSPYRVSFLSWKKLLKGESKANAPDDNLRGRRGPAEVENELAATDLMPVGSEWVGSLFGDLAGERTANGKVVRGDDSSVQLDVQDKHGTYRWTLIFDGDRFYVSTVLGIKPADLSIISRVNIDGRVREGQFSCSGNWLVQNKARGGGGGANVKLELKRK